MGKKCRMTLQIYYIVTVRYQTNTSMSPAVLPAVKDASAVITISDVPNAANNTDPPAELAVVIDPTFAVAPRSSVNPPNKVAAKLSDMVNDCTPVSGLAPGVYFTNPNTGR